MEKFRSIGRDVGVSIVEKQVVPIIGVSKRRHPKSIGHILGNALQRSICNVQVAALLVDSLGRFIAIGWNTVGPTGFGLHAEAHCLVRSNRRRAEYATIYVAAQRRKNGKTVTSRPCESCLKKLGIYGVKAAIYRDGEGKWQKLTLR